MLKKYYSAVGLIALVLTLSGCASTTPLTMKSRNAIQVVAVIPEVEMPDQLVYQGGAQSIGLAFGLIGGVLGSVASTGPAERFAAFMEESEIYVDQIVYSEFIAEFDQAGLFTRKDSGSVDAEIRLEVQLYGLTQVHGLSSRLHPQIAVQSTMVDASGNVVWQEHHRVPPMGAGVPAYSAAEYTENPELLRQAMHAAAQLVSRGLIDSIR